MLVVIPSSNGQKLGNKIQCPTKSTKKARSQRVAFGLHNELQVAVKRTLEMNDELVAISLKGDEINIECYSRDVCLRLYSNSFHLAGNAERLGASIVTLRVNGAIAKKIPVSLMLRLGKG